MSGLGNRDTQLWEPTNAQFTSPGMNDGYKLEQYSK